MEVVEIVGQDRWWGAMGKRETSQLTLSETCGGCGRDWCDGPRSEMLPCFDCFDLARSYRIDASVSSEPDR